ncbi:DUF389 domain-containing protein [Halostella sp. JP-L12]|uniref:DUF389 domain-containing protein n=1 Tax=Halostella TaxID=1843185 RepID=UPI000EF79E1D|nr:MULTISPECIES: DUF389 domain-containing protein [Halostella]NHN48159.1 DUF389 domain-containing protein [Halostella sp. JP-L12]
MRLIQILVSDERRDAVTDALESENVDFVAMRNEAEEGGWVIEFPLPTDAVGTIRDRLEEAGFPEDGYTVLGSAETATTPHSEELQNQFAADFDPLTRPELKSKSQDMSQDPTSFVAMIFFSAVIATAGLLVGSPAVVVGSMVIAPIVGPVLTTGVGAATGDTQMFRDSLWLQLGGIVVAVGGAWLFASALRTGGFVPADLDIAAIQPIALRISPSVFSLVVGLASGAAAAFGLTTKGPTSLIGVMIAAALIPTAATTGIALVWGYPVIAVGTLFLLIATLIAINVGVFVTLRVLGYRSGEWKFLLSGPTRQTATLLVTLVVVLALVGVVAYGSGQQITFQRSASTAAQDVVESSEYAGVNVVSVRTEYTGIKPFSAPENVTIAVSRAQGEEYPDLANAFARAIASETGENVTVSVTYQTYQTSTPESAARAANASDEGNASVPAPARRPAAVRAPAA